MMTRYARTPLILAGSALLVTLAGCGGDEKPAPAGTLEQARQQTRDQNAQRAVDPDQSQSPRDAGEAPRASQPPQAMPETPDADVVVLEGDAVVVGDVEMTAPEAWENGQPTSSMRAAQYAVGDSGAFVIFQGIGGGTEANIQRWIGQISNPADEPVRDIIRRDGLVIHTVEMTGTYQGMTMTGNTPAQSGTTFFGAVVEGGSVPIQIRLTINADEADAARAQWDSLIASIARR